MHFREFGRLFPLGTCTALVTKLNHDHVLKQPCLGSQHLRKPPRPKGLFQSGPGRQVGPSSMDLETVVSQICEFQTCKSAHLSEKFIFKNLQTFSRQRKCIHRWKWTSLAPLQCSIGGGVFTLIKLLCTSSNSVAQISENLKESLRKA